MDPKRAGKSHDDGSGPASVARGRPSAPETVRPPDGSQVRERLVTITDEDALEAARRASVPTGVPPPRAPYATKPEPDDPSASVDIDESEFDVDLLPAEEQVAILRARLAPLTRIPTLTKRMTELGEIVEDPKTAYVLGFVDGLLPLETIIEVTGLPELETLRILDRLSAQQILSFRSLSPMPRAR